MSEFKFNCPHCKQPLEAPEDMLGETIECPSCNGSIQLPEPEPEAAPAPPPAVPKKKTVTGPSKSSGSTKPCPYCGEQILPSAQKCKHCGEFLKGQRETKTNVKQGALIGGWVCFALGVGLMFFSLLSFFVYGPLFLVAFILSIVAMAQRRVAGGVVLLLLTLILPPVLFLGLGAMRVSEVANEVSTAMEEQEQAEAATISKCKIEEPEGYVDGNYMYLKGKVRNNGATSVDYVKVKVEWLDGSKNILDSDWTYAVSGEGLRPGAAKTFEIMSPADNRMESYRYWVEK